MVIRIESNQVATIARDIIAQTAPQELPLFRAHSAAYFKNPDKALQQQVEKDSLLGFGPGEIVVLLTPIVLKVVSEILKTFPEDVRSALIAEGVSLISGRAKEMFKQRQLEARKEQSSPSPLTREQLLHVRTHAYNLFLQYRLPEPLANRLADALLVSLMADSPGGGKE